MGLLKVTDTQYGSAVKANYHRVTEFSVNAVSGAVFATVLSFTSEADHDASASPLLVRRYDLTGLNLLEPIENEDVGKSLYQVVKEALEAKLLTEADFSGATIA